MIQYSLTCENGHAFEAWFKSASAYDDQAARGIVTCPVCSTRKVEKAPMAPAIGHASALAPVETARDDEKVPVSIGHPQQAELRAAMKALRDKVVAEADYVGDQFAAEARRMHADTGEARGIYGEATREEVAGLIEEGIDEGLGVLVWSPLAGGLLSGKYRRDTSPEGSRHTIGFKEPPIYDRDKLYDIVDVIVAVAEAHGVSGAQVALAWLLQRPGVSSIVIGGRTDDHFADNLKAADLKLGADEIARLDAVSQLDLIYPYWHQNFTASDRLGPADLVLHKPYLEG